VEPSNLKVVQVVNTLALGGAEMFAAHLALALSDRCSVQVWTYAGSTDIAGERMETRLQEAGVKVRSLDIKNNRIKSIVPLIWKHWIKTQQPDIVNVHLDQSEFFTAASMRKHRKRPLLVRTLHNTRVTDARLRYLQRWLAPRFDHTVACSDIVLRSSLKRLRSAPASTIPCGTELPPVFDRSRREELRQELGLPSDKLVLLCIGTMNRRCGELVKGQDRILKEFAAAQLASRATLVFIGSGSERQFLESLASELNLASAVRFCGAVQPARKWDYVHACDAGVILSHFEGLPITGMEFACSGKPMLLSDIPELEPFAQASYIASFHDSVGEMIRRFIELLPALSSQAIGLIERYRKTYSIQACADAYHELYSKMLRNENQLAVEDRIRACAPFA
jgi:GalNAc-alpha-(1->4)-GalNAc-alpha-(1->3)-diNAcBac-PP-undecaprenol alpha-1,4-N-acetyl-D-galactosaminyltransferase